MLQRLQQICRPQNRFQIQTLTSPSQVSSDSRQKLLIWYFLAVYNDNNHRHHHTRLTALFRYQKGKTNLDFTEARDSEWQWHQLGHMQVCTLLQTDNHTSTPPLLFFTGRMPFLPPNQQCQSTEGNALKATTTSTTNICSRPKLSRNCEKLTRAAV